MKKLMTILVFMFAMILSAQQIDYNTDNGYIAEGYDVTEYFNNKALEGKSKYVATHDNVKYKFVSQANLEKFKSNPEKFAPKYGGYCSYALATKADKVDIDPETFEINDGRLYLFYNSWGTNTHKKWKSEGAEKLKPKADANWEKVKSKK